MSATIRQMPERKRYKYYDLIMAAFVAVLLCSGIIGVQKVSYVTLPFIGEYIFGAGVLFFPISYLFGDVLTEVYGYKRSRRVIWAGFGALIFASLMSFIITRLPPARTMSAEQVNAVNLVFGQTCESYRWAVGRREGRSRYSGRRKAEEGIKEKGAGKKGQKRLII